MNQKTTNIIVVVGAASLILVISIGIRGSFGLYMTPITNSLQISREVFSIAIAIQMLVWGFGQPIFGAIADLYGTAKVIVLGAGLYACGLTIMGLSSGPVDLYTGAGALVGGGANSSKTNAKEQKLRAVVWNNCLQERGYKVLSAAEGLD